MLQQYKTRSVCLKVNSERSSTKRTGHINIRFLYVIDKDYYGNIVALYHPTKEMIMDYLTKPLNGTPFRTFCNSIMGLDELYIGQYKAKYNNGKQAY